MGGRRTLPVGNEGVANTDLRLITLGVPASIATTCSTVLPRSIPIVIIVEVPCARTSARQGPYQTAPQGRIIPLPKDPLPANDDAAAPTGPGLRNDADGPVPPRIVVLGAAITAEHAARFADPERDPAIMDGLVREFGAAWAKAG